eukprot:3261531-Alexandrium_andersonii.AAC.1
MSASLVGSEMCIRDRASPSESPGSSCTSSDEPAGAAGCALPFVPFADMRPRHKGHLRERRDRGWHRGSPDT